MREEDACVIFALNGRAVVSGPRCSIVIPVHDRAGLTRQCLDAILREPPAVAFEIVVVDDASQDETPEVLAGYGDRRAPCAWTRTWASRPPATPARASGRRAPGVPEQRHDPRAGWLDALVATPTRTRSAGIVGAKLLFPNGTVQHAGVVICQDGNPPHIYAGFPADHPAVNKSRRFQAVTAACMLVRREAFERPADSTPATGTVSRTWTCASAWPRRHEVHYCHESVLYHLESVSRGRRAKEIEHDADGCSARRWDTVPAATTSTTTSPTS